MMLEMTVSRLFMTCQVREAYCVKLLLYEVQVLASEFEWHFNKVCLCKYLQQLDSLLVFLL